jgi:lipopolysaccharide export system permease protein
LVLDLYLTREILRPLTLGLGLLVLIFVGYSSARELSLAAEGVIDATTAIRLIGLNTLITLEILLPSALFFSVLAGIGRLHRDAEMTAFTAAGVSPWRVLEGVLKLALVIAALVGFLSMEGRPWAYREIYRLEANSAAEFDIKRLATGNFVALEGTDYVFIAGDIDLDQGLHKQVFLQRDHADGARSEVIYAREAALPTMDPLERSTTEFYHGYAYVLDHTGTRDLTMKFNQFSILSPELEEARQSYKRKAEATARLAESELPKDIAEFQWRLSTPLATVLLGLLAVPLARSRPRQSRFRNFVIALLVYVVLFSAITVARTWVEQGQIPPLPGVWSGYLLPILLLVLLVQPPRRMRR